VKQYIILNTSRKHVNYEEDKIKVPMNKPCNIHYTNICNGIFHISFVKTLLINEVSCWIQNYENTLPSHFPYVLTVCEDFLGGNLFQNENICCTHSNMKNGAVIINEQSIKLSKSSSRDTHCSCYSTGKQKSKKTQKK
jgi:hypothetical protein